MMFILRKMFLLFAFAGLIAVSLFLKSCGAGFRKGYKIENGEVVRYSGFPATRNVIGEADARSFVALNDDFGKDKKHAFYLGNSILNADAATFEYLASAYSRDKNNGYSRDQLISTDGAHFNFVPNPNETPVNVSAEGIPFARDRYRVYKDTYIVEGADPATFTMVPMFNGNYLTHDRRRVYFQEQPMAGADGATFQKVSDFYFKDKQHAWCLILGRNIYWSQMDNVDVVTFVSLGKSYAKDKKRVYIETDTIAGADPATFNETDYLASRAKNKLQAAGDSATAKK
ncbi:hypothetical protein BH09BAC4_BH09BAC4_49260 [soil metagenome]